MKILHLVHAYFPAIGGSEYLVQKVSEYLANTGKDDVTVFTTFAYNSGLFTGRTQEQVPSNRANEIVKNVVVRRFPVINRWARPLYFFQYALYRTRFPFNGFFRMMYYGPISPGMRSEVKKFDADIIAAAPFPLYHMNYPFFNNKNAPVVLIGCMHTSDKHGFHNPRIVKLIRRADGYVALSPFEKEFMVKTWKIPEEKIAVIGVGIDVRPPSPRSAQVRELFNITSGEPLIGFVGQHGLHKGIKTLIQAMPAVWKKAPKTHLIIAGGTTSFTPMFKKLALAEDEPGNPRIHFIDNVSEALKFDIIEACDIFASPSGFESFGITVLEAWMKKKPVVACDIDVTRTLIQNNENGFLVPYKNHGALADILLTLIEKPSFRSDAGEKGYDQLINHYTSDSIGEQYRAFYDKIIHGRSING